ncbi:MAG: hypothetical protein VYE64_08870 [Planctomycetota bacterium]|nr:hypothetical protein [Planctomycetota bacterium]
MSHCILWVTVSLLFTTANHEPLQVHGFHRQESAESPQSALHLEGSGNKSDQTAAGPLSDRATTEAHLPVIQSWRKSPLETQPRHDAPVNEQQALLEREEEPAQSPAMATGAEWLHGAIGQPGTNHYFLPPNSSPAVFLSADHLTFGNQTTAKQMVTPRIDAAPVVVQQRGKFKEIPETVSPRVTPQLIQVRETRTYQRRLRETTSARRSAPIILRAVPQNRAFQQAGSTARIQVMLPRHQERRPDAASSPTAIIQSSGETEPTSGGFHEEQTEQDTKPSSETI